jgi:oligoendopeptidase F
MAAMVPPRSKIDPKYTWNAESVFPTPAAWETELTAVLDAIPGAKTLQAALSRSPSALADALGSVEDLLARLIRVLVYAGMTYSGDTTDPKAVEMNDKAQGAFGRVSAAVSFVNPELIAIGEEQLKKWAGEEPRLSRYAHFFHNLFRTQANVRSVEVEEVLGLLADSFSGPTGTATMLRNADMKFEAARDSSGRKIEVTQGTVYAILENPDRKARRTAWESYMDAHRALKNTLAGNLVNSIKQNVFMARARRHDSTLAAALFPANIPVAVFHNVVSVFKKNLPVWHRYFEVRRRALGLSDLRHYDMWAPLAKKKVKVGYGQAVDMICNGLAPMGREYVDTVRKGCLEERWVDVFPNKGKRSGAFSWGTYGTHPFIMMSYTGDVTSMSTLAHELGHSMHSYLAWKSQPFIYTDYSIFVAEVASNFHQAMVRAFLLEERKDAGFQVSLIEEAMANFFRYFFIMPTLARFEIETHERVERGEALTSESMIDLMADLLGEGYGSAVKVDRGRDGMLWSTFGHLFMDYYVFQYATGISGAHALSARVLRGERGAVEDYISFLKAGASVYPLDVLKKAGVDLARPKPVEETFALMDGYVGRLEKLL